MSISPLAGKPAPPSMLVNVPKLVTGYYTEQPDPATLEQKRRVTQFSPSEVDVKELAGDPIRAILTNAPGNGGPIGGSKLVTDNEWFAVRPSETEDVYKLYVESFHDRAHLARIQDEAQALIGRLLAQRSHPPVSKAGSS